MDLSSQTTSVLKDLEAALLSGELPQAASQSFESLADKLRRPIRAAVLGIEGQPRRVLLGSILGEDILPVEDDWPTVEFRFAERAQTTATLADGSEMSVEGFPPHDLLAAQPALLQIGAPVALLKRVSFLYVPTEQDAATQAAAMRWVAKRSELSIWCTRRFGKIEAEIWAAAPDALKNHTFLVVLGTLQRTSEIQRRLREDFDSIITLPRRDASTLIRQIEGDIDAALREDIDVARALIQRFAPNHIGSGDPGAGSVPAAEPRGAASGAGRAVSSLLSEPLLYLRRRARAAYQMVAWQDDDEIGSHSDVLNHCCETAEALRDRVSAWPDVEDDIDGLKRFVDGASDMAMLMQIEGGPEQAIDAARLLFQIRNAFEEALRRSRPPQTVGLAR